MSIELTDDQREYLEGMKRKFTDAAEIKEKNQSEITNDMRKAMDSAVSKGIPQFVFIAFFEKVGSPKDILEALKKPKEQD